MSASRTVAGPVGPLAVDVSCDPPADGTLVLVHPINAAAVVWQPLVALCGRPCVALDLRGHGRSTMSGPFGVEDGYLLDLLAVLDALGLSRVHLAGGSLGGSISLAAAARHPDRVLSVTTFGSTLGVGVPDAAIDAMVDELREKGTVGYFRDLVPAIVGSALEAGRRAEVAETMRVAVGERDEAVVAEILHGAFRADVRHLAPDVRVSVLAVAGEQDPTCPPEMTAEIATATDGRSELLPGVGHLPMLEAPERTAELITRNIGAAS